MSLGGGIPLSVIWRGYTSHYYLEEVHVFTVLCGGVHFTVLSPLRVRLLVLAVFKVSCSTPFTHFLRLVSVYRLFYRYFISKTLSTIPLFSAPFLQLIFCLTGHSPVFVCITARLYMVLLFLSAVAFRPSAFAVGGGWDLGGSTTLPRPGFLLDGCLGWPDPVNRLVVFCLNLD